MGEKTCRCRWQIKARLWGEKTRSIATRSKQASKTTMFLREAQADSFWTACKHMIIKYNTFRGVAQLVARLTGGQEAAGSSPVTPTIIVNIRWYKEVISLRGDFFVWKCPKSLIYRGFRLFLFLCSVQYCPGIPSRNWCCYALAFKGYCFETSSYLGVSLRI